jgi:uncharacterized membrane protein YvbJ
MAQIKCPSCGTWSNKGTEFCPSCGERLDARKARLIRLKKEGKLPVKLEPSPMFEIKPEYPWWRKAILYIARPIYWTFFSIVSAIMYLIAWIAA